MAKAEILIVEDDGVVAKDIQNRLKNLGFKAPTMVPSGEEAIKKVKGHKPDLVLMDIMLKGEMNGTEAAEQIRSQFDIPVVYLTAYADEKVLERAKVTEPFGYIIKPFEDRELNAAVEMALYMHKMERKLKESEEWFSTTLNSIGDAVIATDKEGHVTFMNPVAESLTGWDQEEAKGKPLQDVFNIINEETREKVDNPVAKVLREDTVVGPANHTLLITRDGTEIPIDDSGSPIRDEKGDITGAVLVFRDVREKRGAEEVIRQSERRLKEIFEAAENVSFVTTDAAREDPQILEFSPGAERIFGYKREEVIGKPVAILHVPEEVAKFPETIESLHKDKRGFSGESTLVRKSSEKFPALFTTYPIFDGKGNLKETLGVSIDISDRVQAEEALRESEEHFRHAFENANTGVCLVSTDGHFIKVNDRLCEFFGYSKEKLERMSVNDITHPEDLKLSPDFFQRSTSREMDNIVYEKRYIHSKGHLVWGQISSSILRDPEGEPSYFISHVQDITQQKLTEETLKKSEEKFSKLFQANPTYISLATLEEGRFVAVNDAFTKIMGYQPNEVIGRTFREIGLWPDPHDREAFLKQIEEYGSQRLQEVTLTRKDGNLIDGLWSVEKIELEGKAHLISMLVDITEKKRAEEALRESKENLDKAQKIAHIGNWSRDLNLNLAQWSDEMYRIYGLTPGDPAEISFEFILSLIHLEDRERVTSLLKEAAEKKQAFDFEYRTVPIEGLERIIRIRGEVEYDATGNPVRLFGTNQDITETRKLQAQVQESRKVEAIMTLAAGIAHNFNNALTPIIGNVDLLQLDHREDQNTIEGLKDIKASGLHIADLTSQLLAYAEGGKYNPQVQSLNDFVEDTFPLIQHTLDPAVRVETDLSLDVKDVEVDNTQMQMVLSAIMANSNEAMESPGRIRISTRNMDLDQESIKDYPGLKPGPHVCLSIEDEGKGMDEETRNRIFDPFFTTYFMGRGLGMAAVYGIIRNHDGTIAVESELGKGTKVRIYLPAIEAEKKPKKVVVSKPEIELPTGDANILVIEDEEDVMMLIRQVLERLGYRVLEAETGKEAVRLAKTFNGQIDLALLDIKLPDMTGDKVYPLIMEARPDLKVIVCSGYTIEGPPQDILDAGAEGFIKKPFHIATLAEKLKEVLEGK